MAATSLVSTANVVIPVGMVTATMVRTLSMGCTATVNKVTDQEAARHIFFRGLVQAHWLGVA
jgi:hypothetical protein